MSMLATKIDPKAIVLEADVELVREAQIVEGRSLPTMQRLIVTIRAITSDGQVQTVTFEGVAVEFSLEPVAEEDFEILRRLKRDLTETYGIES
jgi:hypothetical protein